MDSEGGEGPRREEADFEGPAKSKGKIVRPNGEDYQFDPANVNKKIKEADEKLKSQGLGGEIPSAQDRYIELDSIEHFLARQEASNKPQDNEKISAREDDGFLEERRKINATERRILLRKATRELKAMANADSDNSAEHGKVKLDHGDGKPHPEHKGPGRRSKPSKEIAKNHPHKRGIVENTTTSSESEIAKNVDSESKTISFDLPQTEMETVEAILKMGTSPKEIIENLNNNSEAGFSSLVDLLEAETQDTENIFNELNPEDIAKRAKFEDRKTILNLAKEAAERKAAGEPLEPDFDPEEPYEDITVTALKAYLDGKIAKNKIWEKDLPEEQKKALEMFAAYFKTLRSQMPQHGLNDQN